MTTSPTDQISGPILHIRSSPLPRPQREALSALGVELEHLTPREISEAIAGAAEEGGAERRDALLRRVAEAPICVLDEGTGLRLGTVLLDVRQNCHGRTITTSDSLHQVAEGIAVRQGVLGVREMRCEHLAKHEVYHTLSRLGAPAITHLVHRTDQQPRVRSARPLPYCGDPTAYTFAEIDDPTNEHWKLHRIHTGRLHPRTLLTPGAAAEPEPHAASALSLLFRHLSEDELGALGSDEARAWWVRLEAERVEVHPFMRPIAIESVIWNALARDGGRATLAALPAGLRPIRDAIAAEWETEVSAVEERLRIDLSSALGDMQRNGVARDALRRWDIVPCEDPLAPDADPHLFRPTLTTLRVARRYRSAPEVLLAAYERWGARPYLEERAEEQLTFFVGESQPTSARDVDNWVRLLTTLPDTKMKRCVNDAIIAHWFLVDAPVVNLLAPSTGRMVNYYERQLATRIPCFTEVGVLREDLVAGIDLPSRRSEIERLEPSLEQLERKRRERLAKAVNPTTPAARKH